MYPLAHATCNAVAPVLWCGFSLTDLLFNHLFASANIWFSSSCLAASASTPKIHYKIHIYRYVFFFINERDIMIIVGVSVFILEEAMVVLPNDPIEKALGVIFNINEGNHVDVMMFYRKKFWKWPHLKKFLIEHWRFTPNTWN